MKRLIGFGGLAAAAVTTLAVALPVMPAQADGIAVCHQTGNGWVAIMPDDSSYAEHVAHGDPSMPVENDSYLGCDALSAPSQPTTPDQPPAPEQPPVEQPEQPPVDSAPSQPEQPPAQTPEQPQPPVIAHPAPAPGPVTHGVHEHRAPHSSTPHQSAPVHHATAHHSALHKPRHSAHHAIVVAAPVAPLTTSDTHLAQSIGVQPAVVAALPRKDREWAKALQHAGVKRHELRQLVTGKAVESGKHRAHKVRVLPNTGAPDNTLLATGALWMVAAGLTVLGINRRRYQPRHAAVHTA